MKVPWTPRHAMRFCDNMLHDFSPRSVYFLARIVRRHTPGGYMEDELFDEVLSGLQDRAELHMSNGLHQGGAWTNLDAFEYRVLYGIAIYWQSGLLEDAKEMASFIADILGCEVPHAVAE